VVVVVVDIVVVIDVVAAVVTFEVIFFAVVLVLDVVVVAYVVVVAGTSVADTCFVVPEGKGVVVEKTFSDVALLIIQGRCA